MTRKIAHPRKRVVVLQFKHKKDVLVYNTCLELVNANNKDKIGVSLNALWNALAQNDGVYENNLCKIHYRKIVNSKNIEWR